MTRVSGSPWRSTWCAAWRWSWSRWLFHRPGKFGLAFLVLVVPGAAFALAGMGGGTEWAAAVRRTFLLGSFLAALLVSKGLADDAWRDGYIVWWLQKGQTAARFVLTRLVLDTVFVLALVCLWSLLGTLALRFGSPDGIFLRALPAEAVGIALAVSLVAFLSAAGSERDSDLAVVILLLGAVWNVGFFADIPGWLHALGRVLLPPLDSLGQVREALQQGDLRAALGRSAWPLAYCGALWVGTLGLVSRRVPHA